MNRHFYLLVLFATTGCLDNENTDSHADETVMFSVLNKPEFKAAYERAFTPLNFTSEQEKDDFSARLAEVRSAIADSLATKWLTPNDFQVSGDFDYCFHTCGGVYSKRIFCEEYVSTILDSLGKVDPDGEWTYHTTCEIATNHPNPKTAGDALEMRGEMFFRDGTCYINGDRMRRDHRTQLGCPD
ncbi:hypothetical protein SV7mr_24710 [Stieleria bergensis]|uniref:Lipoprotein n=1 Tax=Stieleria bergensis TaxID=2528025 RepID=A0A517SV01_9BACT|nr:hypothetical protein SV7mr_24710 [Planctomycetes bacterium SV_7m_r]